MEKAREDLPAQPVYVAPNSLYAAREITPGVDTSDNRTWAIYVGRLEPQKKPRLILEALSHLDPAYGDLRVRIVGTGTELDTLTQLAKTLGVSHRVTFDGWIDDVAPLRELYAGAFCSLSPGFAGLGLTQSLGFGVPMLVARDEPHSPEIELVDTGGVTWFESDDAASLARAMEGAWHRRARLPREGLISTVRSTYSAESMSAGLIEAIELTLSAETSSGIAHRARSAIPGPISKAARVALRKLAVRGPVTYGRSFRVGFGARVHATHELTIGHDVAVGPGSAIQVNGSIGNFVMIGMHVQIVGKKDHDFQEPGTPMLYSGWVGDRSLTDQDLIDIRDDVWIGASSVILSGITIGEGAIIGAGAVVTKNVRPYTIVAGNPAKEVRERFEKESDRKIHVDYLQRQRTI